jgi:RHS repeat-associated protein
MTERSGYSFAGELTALGRSMILFENTQKTESYTYTYDGWGRPLNTSHRLDGATALLLSANAYDAVGRLSQTKRGGTSVQNSTAALTDSYTYNVRDWLTGIGGALFSETLTYETPRTGSTLPGQWSGNISGMQWNTGGTSTPRYDFDYDLLGRLTEAKFGGVSGSTQRNYSRTYGYDLNGNMESMETPDPGAAGYMGDYKSFWTWTPSDGNRPVESERVLYQKGIGPGGTPYYSPVSGSAEEEQYAYDAVGNLMATLDSQGDTLNVMRYNRLNLPEEYLTAEGDSIRYVYSADGEKLYVQEIPSSGTSKGTEYAANYRLEDGSLTMIHTDAGYYTPVTPPSGAGSPSYAHIWYLKDHLGNNRILADGSGNALKIHHYDPFGNQIAVAGGTTTSFPAGATESPYKYGGKEWNTTTLTYDFEARQFAPAFHRFTTMDPLAEKYYSISPYAYCADNPINNIEIKGRIPFASNLLGAVIGAGSEYTSQVIANIIVTGFSKDAFINVDLADVGIAAVEGFITSGTSVLRKQGAKVAVSLGSSILKNSVDYQVDSNSEEDHFRINDAETILAATIVDYCATPLRMAGRGKTSIAKKTTKNQAVKQARAQAHAKGRALGKEAAKKVAKETEKKNLVTKELKEVVDNEMKDYWINTGENTVKMWIFDE